MLDDRQMTLAERLEETRSLCRTMLNSPPLAEAEAFIARAGLTPKVCSGLLRAGAMRKCPAPELTALRPTNVPEGYDFALERALLLRIAVSALDEIPGLPVDESVKHLFCREFTGYAKPPAAALENFAMDGRRFAAMSGIVSLSRFPAGQYHWILSGFPRSWFPKAPLARLPGFCYFLAAQTHGRVPFFEPHLNWTTASRSTFVTEREYFKSFYRMAAAIEMQPRIKGIMASSWLYSRETHRLNPHLAFFNRPYMEAGGFYVDLGPADSGSGFLEGNPQRAELYKSGEYRPTNALVLCSRAQAIAWKQAHPEIAQLLNVK
jgi:hypothetical protein